MPLPNGLPSAADLPAPGPRALQELAAFTGGTIIGPAGGPDPANLLITGCAGLEEAGPGQMSFLANDRYLHQLTTTRAAVVVAKPGVKFPDHLILLQCKDPYYAFTQCVVLIHGYRQHPKVGIQPGANVAANVTLGQDAVIMNGATVGEGCQIGPRTVLYPGVFIGPKCVIGEDCVFYPNVVIYDETQIGNRVVIHANTTIGQDGLGYAPFGENWFKIPQIGRVRIEDDVEIGSNCAIDRATVGETVIGTGTKMSNQIAIGHGCKIGPNCMFVAQVGLAGSVKVGRHVILAGQAGVAGHITIGDNAIVAAQSGVINDVKNGQSVGGAPAAPVTEKKRELIALCKLPALLREAKDFRRQIAALNQAVGRSGSENVPPGDEPNPNGG